MFQSMKNKVIFLAIMLNSVFCAKNHEKVAVATLANQAVKYFEKASENCQCQVRVTMCYIRGIFFSCFK